MKATIALMFLAACNCIAQTNYVFRILKNASGEPVMTNAEFRTLSGRKVFFKNESGYKNFDVTNLDSGVLEQLKISPQSAILTQKKVEESKRAQITAQAEIAKAGQKQQSEYLKKKNLGELVVAWDSNQISSSPDCEVTNSTKETVSFIVTFSHYNYGGQKTKESNCYINNIKPNEAGKDSILYPDSKIQLDKIKWRTGDSGSWNDAKLAPVKTFKTLMPGTEFEYRLQQTTYRIQPSEDELKGMAP